MKPVIQSQLREESDKAVLLPDLFSVYSEVLINALEDLNGVSVGGVNINNLRYADDTVLMAKCVEDLQKLVN